MTPIKSFYQNNPRLFTLKTYPFGVKLDKGIILLGLYYAMLVGFYILMGALLDCSLKDYWINCENKQFWLICFSLTMLLYISKKIGTVKSLNLIFEYFNTIINLIPYILIALFVYYIMYQPSLDEVLNTISTLSSYRWNLIMIIFIICIITNQSILNLLFFISLANVTSFFFISVSGLIIKDLAFLFDYLSNKNVLTKEKYLSLKDEARILYEQTLLEKSIAYEKAEKTKWIAYGLSCISKIFWSFYKGFLPPNIDQIRYNIGFCDFFEKFLIERGFVIEVNEDGSSKVIEDKSSKIDRSSKLSDESSFLKKLDSFNKWADKQPRFIRNWLKMFRPFTLEEKITFKFPEHLSKRFIDVKPLPELRYSPILSRLDASHYGYPRPNLRQSWFYIGEIDEDGSVIERSTPLSPLTLRWGGPGGSALAAGSSNTLESKRLITFLERKPITSGVTLKSLRLEDGTLVNFIQALTNSLSSNISAQGQQDFSNKWDEKTLVGSPALSEASLKNLEKSEGRWPTFMGGNKKF